MIQITRTERKAATAADGNGGQAITDGRSGRGAGRAGAAPAGLPQADAADVAREFFALGDATRVAVLEMLTGGERCVCELVDALGAAQPRLSFHLRTLREAGAVRAVRRGRWIYYSLEEDFMNTMAKRLGEWVERSRSAGGSCGCGGAEGCCGCA